MDRLSAPASARGAATWVQASCSTGPRSAAARDGLQGGEADRLGQGALAGVASALGDLDGDGSTGHLYRGPRGQPGRGTRRFRRATSSRRSPGEGWRISWSPESRRVAAWVRWAETIGVYGLDGVR